MKKLKLFLFSSVIFIVFFTSSQPVSADGWWGYGHRSKKWILSHGGTIIYYKIKGLPRVKKKKLKAYKAVMTNKKGRFVEVELGKKGYFDDAKDGVYKITMYKGGPRRKTEKGGTGVVTVKVKAAPGKVIYVNFNAKKKKGHVTKSKFKISRKASKKSQKR